MVPYPFIDCPLPNYSAHTQAVKRREERNRESQETEEIIESLEQRVAELEKENARLHALPPRERVEYIENESIDLSIGSGGLRSQVCLISIFIAEILMKLMPTCDFGY